MTVERARPARATKPPSPLGPLLARRPRLSPPLGAGRVASRGPLGAAGGRGGGWPWTVLHVMPTFPPPTAARAMGAGLGTGRVQEPVLMVQAGAELFCTK